jgi:glycine C-acetyltransferase
MTDLDRLLARKKRHTRDKLIVTDGVFSMHGRITPLPHLHQLADHHAAHLMVDDTHGLGVLGPNGRGIEGSGRCRGRWTCSWEPSARRRARWAAT